MRSGKTRTSPGVSQDLRTALGKRREGEAAPVAASGINKREEHSCCSVPRGWQVLSVKSSTSFVTMSHAPLSWRSTRLHRQQKLCYLRPVPSHRQQRPSSCAPPVTPLPISPHRKRQVPLPASPRMPRRPLPPVHQLDTKMRPAGEGVGLPPVAIMSKKAMETFPGRGWRGGWRGRGRSSCLGVCT